MPIQKKQKQANRENRYGTFEITSYGIKRVTTVKQRIALFEDAVKAIDRLVKKLRPASEVPVNKNVKK